MKGFTLFVGCVLLVILLAPVTAWASQTSRTLQPGRTYEFVSVEPWVISHVRTADGARYEFVEINSENEITNFGFARWWVSVAGRTAITPLAPMSVTFDTARLRLYESEGSVLRQIDLSAGQTATLDSTWASALNIRTNQDSYFDLLITDPFGAVHSINQDSRLARLSIVGGGTVFVTPDGDLTLYFPAAWYSTRLRSGFVEHPALLIHPLEAGAVYFFANLGRDPLPLIVEPYYSGLVFRYDFVTRGRDGHVAGYGTVSGNEILLRPNHDITITPLANAKLIFPYTWLNYLDIDLGVSIPLYYALAPGYSLRIKNYETTRAHAIYIRGLSAEEGEFYAEFEYDMVLRHNGEVTFIREGSAGRISIPAGAELTLTAGVGYGLAVNFPENPVISVEPGYPALFRYYLAPGASAVIEGVDDVYKRAVSEDDIYLDFVLWHDGGLVDFGRRDFGRLLLGYGEKLRVTNPGDEPVVFYAPMIWRETGLIMTASETPALFRYILEEGYALQIDNIDRRFHHEFAVEHESGRFAGSLFEYLHTNQRQSRHRLFELYGYGESSTRLNSLPLEERLVISPARGQVISFVIPYEWYGLYFDITPAELPLHRFTLSPGERLRITNRTNENFYLSNNSAVGGARYTLRFAWGAPRADEALEAAIREETRLNNRISQVNRQHHQLLSLVAALEEPIHVDDSFYIALQQELSAELVRVRTEINQLRNNEAPAANAPMFGPISLTTNSEIIITAGTGADLEIWMPRIWAERLGLV